MRFRVSGFRFRVSGFRFRVPGIYPTNAIFQGSGFGVESLGLRVSGLPRRCTPRPAWLAAGSVGGWRGSGLRIRDFDIRVSGSGFRVRSFGLRVSSFALRGYAVGAMPGAPPWLRV